MQLIPVLSLVSSARIKNKWSLWIVNEFWNHVKLISSMCAEIKFFLLSLFKIKQMGFCDRTKLTREGNYLNRNSISNFIPKRNWNISTSLPIKKIKYLSTITRSKCLISRIRKFKNSYNSETYIFSFYS